MQKESSPLFSTGRTSPERTLTEPKLAEGASENRGRGPQYYAKDPTDLRLSVSAVVWQEPGSAEEHRDSGAHILLMRRSDNGRWGLPGGYVERGESVAEAAAREVKEETGYEVEIGGLIGVYSDPARQVIAYTPEKRVQAVNLCFHARPTAKGEMTTPEETLEIGFFDVGGLPEPMVPIHDVRIEDAISGRAGNTGAQVR